MPEIGGKEVVFTERLPARVWWDLYGKLAEIQAGDSVRDKLGWDGSVDLCRAVVVSWGFEGDPQDARAYEALEYLTLIELVMACFRHAIGLFNRRAAEQPGE